jgi:hypothetical protein
MSPSFPRLGLVRPLRLLVASVLVSLLALSVSATASGATGPDAFGVSVGGDIQSEAAATRDRELDAIAAMGARWVRVDVNWAQIQSGGPSSFNWGVLDPTVQAITARHMKVLGLITYTPRWARPSGASSTYGPDPDQFATFASAAVQHYSAMGVTAYEIWNEPNVSYFWTPAPDPAAYTRLLRAAYAAIKAVEPQATVLTGGTSPASTNGTNYSPVDFLRGIYANGGHGSFDAVANHPYCWPAYPGDAAGWSSWYQMYGTSPSLRSLMSANGDAAKQIWGTEFGAPTNGPAGSYVSESVQAQMISRAYSLWQTYDWAGPLFTYEGRDYGTDASNREDWFGLIRYDWSLKPSYVAYQSLASAASSGGSTGTGGTSGGTSGTGGTGTSGGSGSGTTDTSGSSGSGTTGTSGSSGSGTTDTTGTSGSGGTGTTGTSGSGGTGSSTGTGGTTTTGGTTSTPGKVKIKKKGRGRLLGRVLTQSAFRRDRVGSRRVRVMLLVNRRVQTSFWHLGSRRGASSWLASGRFRFSTW